MRCEHCRELLFEGDEAQTHLSGCADCRVALEQWRLLQHALADVEPSRDFDKTFFAKLAAEKPKRQWLRFVEPLLVASCATVLAMVAVSRPGLSPEQAFIAQNQEMLAHLDLALQLDQLPANAEDLAIIRELQNLPRANVPGGK